MESTEPKYEPTYLSNLKLERDSEGKVTAVYRRMFHFHEVWDRVWQYDPAQASAEDYIVTFYQIAERDDGSLSEYSRNELRISLLYKLADYLGMTIAELVAGIGSSPDKPPMPEVNPSITGKAEGLDTAL